MEDTERLLKGVVEELDRLLSAKNVLAAPIEKDGLTVIPLARPSPSRGALALIRCVTERIRSGLGAVNRRHCRPRAASSGSEIFLFS